VEKIAPWTEQLQEPAQDRIGHGTDRPHKTTFTEASDDGSGEHSRYFTGGQEK
jgi:hypothetical protein